jgi:tRNA (guanine37-N1)-methyltransferase
MSFLNVQILTIFPEIFPGALEHSLAGKALKEGIWSLDLINIRNFGHGRHYKVDWKRCGGGSGLVMRPDVLGKALDYALSMQPDSTIIYPSPRGTVLNQEGSHKIKALKNIIILCGRFEGIDERIIDEYNVMQISIGDYILSGGELAAMVILDSVIRLLPGVILNHETVENESFKETDGAKLLEYPLYTKPINWRGRSVPQVLLSGNHSAISKWQHDQSLSLTKKLRPDLIK